MTAKPTAADQPFTVVLDDDETTVAEGRLRDIDAGPTWAKNRVRISLDDRDDTSGHAIDATAVAVTPALRDDVESPALSLHVPTAEKAASRRVTGRPRRPRPAPGAPGRPPAGSACPGS